MKISNSMVSGQCKRMRILKKSYDFKDGKKHLFCLFMSVAVRGLRSLVVYVDVG